MKVSTMLGSTLVGVLFASVLLVSVTSSKLATTEAVYNPWYDLDNDGDIDIFDIVRMAGSYGMTGEPFSAKAAIEYESEWIDITDKAGQYFSIAHNLDSMDILVDIQGKTALSGGIHQRHLGGTGYSQGWNRTYGGLGDDYVGLARCIVQTTDGGYAVAGGIDHTFDPLLVGDAWLVKTDALGNMQWNKTYGGTGDDWAYSVVQTFDGGYAWAGATDSYGTVASDYDFWLVKTDIAGNMQWNKTYGGTHDDWATCMVQAFDGGYALAGYTHWQGAGAYDFWLIKTDASGNVQWSKTYGGSGDDIGSTVIQINDGGYAIAGSTQSYGVGSDDFWLVRTDSYGNHIWNETYGGTGSDMANSIAQTNDGGYALAGPTQSYGAGDTDFWIVKTDANGNHLWDETYGGTGRDVANSVIQANDGGYIIAGGVDQTISGSWPPPSGDAWVVKTDATGQMEWNRVYDGSLYDQAWSVCKTSDAGYAIACETNSTTTNNVDVWLIKTDSNGNPQPSFEYGLAWVDSAPNTVTLYRGTEDIHWNYVRVRVWKIEEDP